MDATTDLKLRRRAIEAARAGLETPDLSVDPLVVASWRRSATRVPDDRTAAPVDGLAEVRDRWDDSTLNRPVLGLVEELDHIAKSSDLIACVTDPDGRVLWQSTPRGLRA